jgi:hypothetical protein
LPEFPKNKVRSKSPRLDQTTATIELSQFDRTHFGTLSNAQNAIYQAVSLGISHSIDMGLRAEREQFYPLLMSAEVQENLQRFVNRSKPSS